MRFLFCQYFVFIQARFVMNRKDSKAFIYLDSLNLQGEVFSYRFISRISRIRALMSFVTSIFGILLFQGTRTHPFEVENFVSSAASVCMGPLVG